MLEVRWWCTFFVYVYEYVFLQINVCLIFVNNVLCLTILGTTLKNIYYDIAVRKYLIDIELFLS